MKILVGDKFMRETLYGKTIAYEVLDIKYSWGMYWDLKEVIVYKGEGPTIWEKSRPEFERIMNYVNAFRVPKGDLGGIRNFVPRHKFK